MRKIILGFSTLLIIFSSSAQSFRILNGFSVSKSVGTDEYSVDNKLNFHAVSTGAEMNYFEHKKFRINTRLTFAERGDTYKNNHSEILKFYYDYASINTTFAFKLNTKIVNFNIYAGPRFDYLLFCRGYSTGLFGYFYDINYGIDIGLGVEMPIKDFFLLGLDVVYNHEAKNIFSVDSWQVIPNYAGVINLSFGIRIDKK